MTKQIQLKLSKIKYSGDSIGDDIRIEIECLGKFVSVKKKIKSGGEVNFNKGIGAFFAEGASFSLPVNIKIIEEDLIFNDVGSQEIKLKINLDSDIPQASVHKVEVRELRNFISKKTAIFEITLEVVVGYAIVYVKDVGDDGWLNVIRLDTKETIALPANLKVRMSEVTSGREYFIVLEGPLTGINASVELNEQGKTRFSSVNLQTASARLIYSISKKILKFKNEIYKATDDPASPWEKGMYDVEIPDFPHPAGLNYPESKYAKAWFRIGHSGARYLHAGVFSAGCLTIIEVKRWDEIWNNLIKARKGDGKSVGVLEVVD